jgi:tRNA (cytidine/uridine-2'-O-)-methyltransferase
MFHVILLHPEIPQNTGNIGRMCAFCGCRLHLIHPLGFELSDRYLKRSGMDYWQFLEVTHHESWEAFVRSDLRPEGKVVLFTTHAKKSYWDFRFDPGDGLLFGNEGSGAPEEVHQWVGDNRAKIPQLVPGLRSLNLSTAAGIATYEALRQQHVQGT